jgi:UDP-2,3-diacylglucosamine hydrolase
VSGTTASRAGANDAATGPAAVTPYPLATPIAAARDDDRTHTWILSDLHVDEDSYEVANAFARVLESAARHGSAARVLILGDLFEFYATPRQLDHGAWRTLRDALAHARTAGVSVTLLRGNRDFVLDSRFERRTDCRVVPGGLSFVLDGRRVLALHGDELCLRDVDYQRLKPWIRGGFFALLSHALPPAWALGVGRAVRRRAIRTQQRRAQQPARPAPRPRDPLRFEPVLEAVEGAFAASSAEVLVFGHIHAASATDLGARRVLVLPAFERDGVHLRAEPGRALRHVDVEGRDVPGVRARTFPMLHDEVE